MSEDSQVVKINKGIIILVGLPYSGKTTWARKQGFPIVNADSIRLALHGERYIPAAEDFVWAMNFAMIYALLYAGHDKVIVDATHMTESRRGVYPIKFPDVTIDYKVFDTTIVECVTRAKKNKDDLIIPVIKRMSESYEPCKDTYEEKCCEDGVVS